MQNFKYVFEDDCPYFGKLLYLYMADGFDRKKISLLQFLQKMFPLYDNEQKQHHNKIAFAIYDLDRDKELNIINLVDLQQNLHP